MEQSRPQQLSQLPDQSTTPLKKNSHISTSKILIFIAATLLVTVAVVGGIFFWMKRSRLVQNVELPDGNTTTVKVTKPLITVHTDFSNFKGTYVTWNDANNPDIAEKQKIYFQQGGEKVAVATIPNLYAGHYHNAEFHDGALYAILRVGYDGYPDKDWQDELWRYDNAGFGTKLFASQGIDFSASPTNALVAITHNNTNELVFIDKNGQQVKSFLLSELLEKPENQLTINLHDWTKDGERFNGGVSFTAYPYGFFTINKNTWQVKKYELPKEGFGFSPNFDREIAAYHTFPVFFDDDTYNDYTASNPVVELKVYDFATKKTQIISTTNAKPFTYKWIDTQTLEYSTESTAKKIFTLTK